MATIDLTKETFEETVTGNDIVLMDFWASWCGPCKQFAPVFESMSESHPEAVFAKINTEEQQELAGYFQIRSIPTLMIFREQIIVFSQAGALPPAALEDVLEKVAALDMDDVRRQVAEQAAEQAGEDGSVA